MNKKSNASRYVTASVWAIIALFLTVIMIMGMSRRQAFAQSFEDKADEIADYFNGKGIEITINDGENVNINGLEVTENDSGLPARYNYASSSFDSVDIDLVSEEVCIEESDSAKEAELLFEGKWDMSKIKYGVKDKTLYVKRIGNEHKSYKGRRILHVTLPSGQYRTISGKTVSGSLLMDNINVNEIQTETVSGSSNIKGCNAKMVDLSSVSGTINLDSAVRQFNAEAVSGSIKIKSGEKLTSKCSAESVSGSILIDLNRQGADLDYSTTSGCVNI